MIADHETFDALTWPLRIDERHWFIQPVVLGMSDMPGRPWRVPFHLPRASFVLTRPPTLYPRGRYRTSSCSTMMLNSLDSSLQRHTPGSHGHVRPPPAPHRHRQPTNKTTNSSTGRSPRNSFLGRTRGRATFLPPCHCAPLIG